MILTSIFNNTCTYCIVINFTFNTKPEFNFKSPYSDVGLLKR